MRHHPDGSETPSGWPVYRAQGKNTFFFFVFRRRGICQSRARQHATGQACPGPGMFPGPRRRKTKRSFWGLAGLSTGHPDGVWGLNAGSHPQIDALKMRVTTGAERGVNERRQLTFVHHYETCRLRLPRIGRSEVCRESGVNRGVGRVAEVRGHDGHSTMEFRIERIYS